MGVETRSFFNAEDILPRMAINIIDTTSFGTELKAAMPSIRNDFPETWLWNHLENNSGFVNSFKLLHF